MIEKDPNSFIVGNAENRGNGIWIIGGRACEDISIGDILSDNKNNESQVIMKVQAIVAYGKQLDVICTMTSGWLFVVGDNLDKLKSAKYLHKI